MKNAPKSYVWRDGKFSTLSGTHVSLLNHSLHYGSAVFEGIRCYETAEGPAVFRLNGHVDRLFHSAKVMGMKLPYTKRELSEAILDTVRKNKLHECYIRPIAYYEEKMGLLPSGSHVHAAVATWPWGRYLKNDDTTVHIVALRRVHPESGVMSAKIAGQYYNSILAGLEAKRKKADEALLLDWKGNIAEGPGENIFFVKGKTLYTPKDTAILPGITRETIIEIAPTLGYRVVEKDIKPRTLPSFDEAFFVGTAVEVHPIARVDDVSFTSTKEGSVSRKIQAAYSEIIHGERVANRRWLTYV